MKFISIYILLGLFILTSCKNKVDVKTTLNNIQNEAFEKNEAYENIKTLCSLGNHRYTGLEECKRALGFIEKQISYYKNKTSKKIAYEDNIWKRKSEKLKIFSKKDTISLDCKTWKGSPLESEVNSEIIFIEPKDLDKKSKLVGKILVIEASYQTIKEVIESSLETGALAVVIIYNQGNNIICGELPLNQNCRFPVICISQESGILLKNFTKNNKKSYASINISLEIVKQKVEWLTASIIKDPNLPTLVVTSDFDTWDISCGVSQNGMSSIILLEALRILQKNNENINQNIMFCWLTGSIQKNAGRKSLLKYIKKNKINISGWLDVTGTQDFVGIASSDEKFYNKLQSIKKSLNEYDPNFQILKGISNENRNKLVESLYYGHTLSNQDFGHEIYINTDADNFDLADKSVITKSSGTLALILFLLSN